MPHLGPDRLTLIAVGDHSGDAREAGHLGDCAACRDELWALRQVAARAREAQAVRDLPLPPERVWQRILTDLAFPPPAPARHRPEPHRRDRWLPRLVAVAATAAVLAAGGTLGATRLLTPPDPDPPAVTAEAPLAALPAGTTTAEGTAQVRDGRTLHLRLTGLAGGAAPGGYHEVWLIDPDTMEMISLGVLAGAEADLPLPPAVDLAAYRLVDISLEPYDGDPTHSGDSLVRGQLATG